MLAKLLTCSVIGIDALIVEVEVDLAKGLPSFFIVGLPDIAVKESKNRVQSAIKNIGIEYPLNRITINLAPANIKKEGSSFDLPIAIGILCAKGIIPKDIGNKFVFIGELSLDGTIKHVKGVLPSVLAVKSSGIGSIILPVSNANEASVVKDVNAIGVKNLPEVIEFLNGKIDISPARYNPSLESIIEDYNKGDFSDVKGQYHVKRALEVASAGGHNVIMIGPPGSGKSMLAKRISGILPDMTIDEAIETTKIHSVIGLLKENQSLVNNRPFRAPHHTISDAGLIGGGHIPMPGEVSISHNGVLFLDELSEFKRNVLEVMRQPIEDGIVTISRASGSLTFPSRFMLVAATNPCPCGYWNSPIKMCTCSQIQIKNYTAKLSSPLMDRIDIHIDVPALSFQDMGKYSGGEPSKEIKKRVSLARKIQMERFSHYNKIYSNAQMASSHIKRYCKLSNECRTLLDSAVKNLGLSARAYDKVLKVARTIADIDGKGDISSVHLAEAIQYRSLDRKDSYFK